MILDPDLLHKTLQKLRISWENWITLAYNYQMVKQNYVFKAKNYVVFLYIFLFYVIMLCNVWWNLFAHVLETCRLPMHIFTQVVIINVVNLLLIWGLFICTELTSFTKQYNFFNRKSIKNMFMISMFDEQFVPCPLLAASSWQDPSVVFLVQ